MGWLSAILGLAGLLGGGSQGQSSDPRQQALINETLANQTRRMNMQNPLYEAVQKLAMRLMPTAVQGQTPTWHDTRSEGSYTGPVSQGGFPPVPDPSTPNPGESSPPGPGREDPDPRGPERDPRDPRAPRVTSGGSGIDPVSLARLFGQR
jgi:hypothetical protein